MQYTNTTTAGMWHIWQQTTDAHLVHVLPHVSGAFHNHQADFCFRIQIRPSNSSLSLAVCVQGVSYGVFGLGNKQYEHFCAVGHKVHAAMEQLGAQPVVRRGDGDDDVDIDADFESWRTELYTSLDGSSLLDKREVCYVAYHSSLHSGRCTPLLCAHFYSRSASMCKQTWAPIAIFSTCQHCIWA